MYINEMVYDPYIDRLGKWLREKKNVHMDDGHREILRLMWAKWEEDHPIGVFTHSKTGQPELRMITESYDKPKGIVSFDKYRGISEAGSMLWAHRFSRTEDGKMCGQDGRITSNDTLDDFEHFNWVEPKKGYHYLYYYYLGNDVTRENVVSLAYGISAFLMPLTGCEIQDTIMDLLAERERARLEPLLKEYIKANVTPEIGEFIEQQNIMHSAPVEWLMAGGDETLRKYRLQAAQAYPLFMPFFDGRFRYKEEDGNQRDKVEEICKAIDEGRPLAKLLQTNLFPFEVPAPLVRNLARIGKIPDFMDRGDLLPHYRRLVDILPYLCNSQPDFHPKTGEGLRAYFICYKHAEIFNEELSRPVEDIMDRIKGKWTEWAEATNTLRDVRGTKDLIGQFSNTVVWPAFWRAFFS